MKIMFIEPPIQSAIQSRLGVTGLPSSSYLAPFLEEDGHEVKIVDSPTMKYDLDGVRRKLKEFGPELVGISSTTPAVYDVYKVGEIAKKLSPSSTVVVGGPHPTFAARSMLEECTHIDIAVRGEGEETVKRIAELRNLEDIRGITYRKDDKIVESENRPPIMDLDSLPFPAYHLLPMDRYKVNGIKYVTMVTSRGCPFNCTFCSSSGICGKKWRAKSPQRVASQIKFLIDEYNVREIEMLDDTFTLNKNRTVETCDLIIKERFDISWTCSSRVDTITKSVAEKLKKAGCHTIYMGIESGSQKILDSLKKGISLEQIERAARKVKEAGLNTVGSFIIGVFEETEKQALKTLEFSKKLGLTAAQYTIFTPYPGTEAYSKAEKEDLLLTRDWSKYDTLNPVVKLPKFSADNLKKLLRKAYLKFYLSPSYIWESIKGGRIWTILKLLLKW